MKTLVQARIDNKLKESAEKILDYYGLDIPTLFRMALCATVNTKGVPFPISQANDPAVEDYRDFKAADSAYNEFVKSGKKTNSIYKLAAKFGIAKKK
jgi:addiction module RelB/DinJ family antitoxin